MSFNTVTIVGNLGRDPELRYTPSGTAVCNISVATTEKRKKGGTVEEITTWFRATIWGAMAENAAKYLQKGSAVYLSGPLRKEEYTDKDEVNRVSLEVNVREMQFLSGGSRKQEEESDDDGYTGEDEGDEDDFDPDDEEEEVPVRRSAAKATSKKAPARKVIAAKKAPAKAAAKKPAAKKRPRDDDDYPAF